MNEIEAFDAGRRHRVDVGNNDQVLGKRLVLGRDDLHAGRGCCKNNFGVGDDIALLVGGFAVDGFEIDAETGPSRLQRS